MGNKVKKIIYLTIAFICFGIGVVGIIIPVLPTTPFLLLSSYCFARGFEKFNNWFLETKLYKKHLESFVKTRKMTGKSKVGILLPVSTLLAIAFIFAPTWYLRVFIVGVFLFKHYYFLFCIETTKAIDKCNQKQ